MPSNQDLLETVLALPEKDRIELVEALLASFSPPGLDLEDEELSAELERRWQEYLADPSTAMTWEEAERLADEEMKNPSEGPCPQ